MNLPSKSNAATVTHAVTKDFAGHDLVGLEDCNKLLSRVSTLHGFRKSRGETNSLCDRLWQVGDIQIGRLFVSLSLEASIEALPCEANLIAEKVEGLNALLGITDMLELGKAESAPISILPWIGPDYSEHLPLAGTGGSVNDCLALLNLTESRGVLQQKLIISGGVKATNVDVPVTIDAVFQALVQGLALLWGGEYSGHSGRDRGILLSQSTQFSLSNSLSLGADRTESSRHSKLLWGRGGIAGSISRHDTRSRLSVSHASKERRARGRLRGSG